MEVEELERSEDELKFLYEMDFWLHTCFDGLEIMIAEWKVIRFGQVGVWNQQNLYPRISTNDVAKLLQYSGSRVEHGDGFSS